jgi:cell shape-determining protein MreC
VGRIVSAGPSAACLALLTHRGVRVAARLAECRADGVLQGTRDSGSERLCKLTVIAPDLQARAGEHVVSSGLDGSFPPGCWLGDVIAVEQKGNLEWELTVRPACDAARLEAVYVLTDPPAEVPWPAAGRGRK